MPSCGYEPIDRKRTKKILSSGKKMWKFPKAYAILIDTLCKSFYLEVMFMEYIEKRLEGDIKYSGARSWSIPAELPYCPWMRTAIAIWCASSVIPSSG